MTPPFTPEQEAAIERIAEARAAAMIGQALRGAAERIAAAIVGGPVVVLPVLHMADLVAEPTSPSSGKTGDLSQREADPCR